MMMMMAAKIGILLHLALSAAFAPPRPVATTTRIASVQYGRLHAASDGSDGDNPTLDLIRSWLLARLPSLRGTDELSLYSDCLLNDGYSTTDELDGLNSGASGRVEDLYFMRKGHRQSLMRELRSDNDDADSQPTKFTSTEVDGEFAIVEEFLSAPPMDDDEDIIMEEEEIKGEEEEVKSTSGYYHSWLVDLRDLILIKANEAGTTEAAPETMLEPAKRSLSEDERCHRPTVSSRREREVAADFRCPGDSNSLTRRSASRERSPNPIFSLSGEEQRIRPVVSSGRDRRAELSAVRRGFGDETSAGRKKADRSLPNQVSASSSSSLSGEERCSRPAASSGRDRQAELETVCRGFDDDNNSPARKADKPSQDPVSVTLLSRGEARVRPAPSSGVSSEYFTVNDRTGDARRLTQRRVNVNKSTREAKVLSRAADSTHNNIVTRKSLLSDKSKDKEAPNQARATAATRQASSMLAGLSKATDDSSNVADTSKNEVLSRSTATQGSSSMLTILSRTADSNATTAEMPAAAAKEEEVTLLRSLAREGRPRVGCRERRDAPFHYSVSAPFQPSSLRSLLKEGPPFEGMV